ncbi:MAG TPA: hypothetical protein VF310_02725 [Vicinamibacteria bacterium]
MSDLDQARVELKLARFAVPAALAAAWLLVQSGLGRLLARLASGMWLHELGHALAAWTCGFPAIPGPWFTSVGEERSWVFALPLTAGLAWACWQARAAERRPLLWAAGAALAAQLFGTLVVTPRQASAFISFAGDAGSLVLGAALMAAFFVRPGHPLHLGSLRWGLLALGALGFADTFDLWWRARSDPGVIPFGEFEHGGESDPTVLVAIYRWTVPSLVARYLAVGALSLAALAVLQFLHVRRCRAELEAQEG